MIDMKRIALIATIVAATQPGYVLADPPSIVAPAADAPAIPPVTDRAIVGQDGVGVSNEKIALVKIVRPDRAEAKKDPLSQFGAGFSIVAFNKSGDPVSFGPESIVVKDSKGQILTILTADKIAELKQKQADHARTMGMLLGFAVGAMGAVGAGSANATTAANSAVLQSEGMALIATSDNNATAIASQTDALVAAYNPTPLVSGPVAPLHAACGRVLVQGIKDKDAAVVIVTIGGEVHEIDFSTGKHS
jgi:hypothetical protein